MPSSTPKERVVEEQTALDGKIDGLRLFMTTKKFNELDETNRMLLSTQLNIMKSYSEVLELRLTNWGDENVK